MPDGGNKEEQMSDGTLSQDEIDALLAEAAGDIGGISATSQEVIESDLGPSEIKKLNKVFEEALQSSSIVLGTVLGDEVSFKGISGGLQSSASLQEKFDRKFIAASTSLKEDISGSMSFLIPMEEARKLGLSMMGETGESQADQPLTEQQTQALVEVMNNFFSTITNSLGEKVGATVLNDVVSLNNIEQGAEPGFGGEIYVISAKIKVGAMLESDCFLVFPRDTAKALARLETGGPREYTVQEVKTEAVPTSAPPPSVRVGPAASRPGQAMGAGVRVQPVQFQDLGGGGLEPLPTNIQLLMDVPMDVTVELGRTRRLVKDILELGTGSIIELDKLAGEAVDIMVNGKLIAKGEVVVIDENFGVRVTDIISQIERITNLQ